LAAVRSRRRFGAVMKQGVRFSGFRRVAVVERAARIAEATGCGKDEITAALHRGGLEARAADKIVENVLGTYALPYGVVLHMRVNGRDRVVPVAVEEPSVVAAASSAAKMALAGGGFHADADASWMIGQIQLVDVRDPVAAAMRVLEHKSAILAIADAAVPGLVRRGGGVRDVEARILGEPADAMLCVHLVVDCVDAMGANFVTAAAEAVGDELAVLARARVGVRAASMLCDRRRVRVTCNVPAAALGTETMPGPDVVDGIVNASRFAELDPYRAATHNKGIMNGIDAVTLATGNDVRAVEAGAHAFAVRRGRYAPLAIWRRVEGPAGETSLLGTLELPLAVGIASASQQVHRAAQMSLRLLGVKSAGELAGIAAAVGLASNLAAVRALATDGIQRGHMALHARAVALAAGATGELVQIVAARIVDARDVTLDGARAALKDLGGAVRRSAGED